jgi:predicted nucleotidyltransferase
VGASEKLPQNEVAKRPCDQVLDFLADELRRSGVRIERPILFGTQARGTVHEDSDVDVALVSPDFRDKDIFERVELVKKADMATTMKFIVPLDLVMLTPEEYESRSSPIASFAHDGEEFSAS